VFCLENTKVEKILSPGTIAGIATFDGKNQKNVKQLISVTQIS